MPAHSSLIDVRTGSGFDVHPLAEGRGVWLCGVLIPCALHALGHSDADVALHALADALFGTICAGDLGEHFPPSDPQWRGCASEVFVRKAHEFVRSSRGRINHVDITILAEHPHIAPHRAAMAACVANMLDIQESRVSIKATTTEHLGFIGRKEGIAAHAVVTVVFNESNSST